MKIPLVAAVFFMVHVFCLAVVWKTSSSIHTFNKRLLDIEQQNVASATVLKAQVETNKNKIKTIETDSDIHAKILYEMFAQEEDFSPEESDEPLPDTAPINNVHE